MEVLTIKNNINVVISNFVGYFFKIGKTTSNIVSKNLDEIFFIFAEIKIQSYV